MTPLSQRSKSTSDVARLAYSHPTEARMDQDPRWRCPRRAQRQDSLEDQMKDILHLATLFGCYDAADAIGRTFLR